jgi:hypothetical protein
MTGIMISKEEDISRPILLLGIQPGQKIGTLNELCIDISHLKMLKKARQKER